MDPDYRNVFVETGGRKYRVPFHVGLRKAMLVALCPQHRGGRERVFPPDTRRAKQIIKLALVDLPQS